MLRQHPLLSHQSSPRIAGGDLKGRRLRVPAGKTVRPMRTRIRESLFGSLVGQLDGAYVLDVFSGSGAIGLEAVSRGAWHATLIENHPEVLKSLRQTVADFQLGPRIDIQNINIYQQLPTTAEPYRLIFLDPPFPDYRNPQADADPLRLITQLAQSPLLAPQGILGFEYPSIMTAPLPPTNFEVRLNRKYGDTTIILWQQHSA